MGGALIAIYITETLDMIQRSGILVINATQVMYHQVMISLARFSMLFGGSFLFCRPTCFILILGDKVKISYHDHHMSDVQCSRLEQDTIISSYSVLARIGFDSEPHLNYGK